MRARRFYSANAVFKLVGGNEDNDLWVERRDDGYGPQIRSVWELTDDERARIVAGANVELITIGDGTPPLMMGVTDEPLGKRHE